MTRKRLADVDANLIRPALADVVAYEPGKPVEELQRELGLERVVKLASNEGQYGPFPAALEAMERASTRAEPISGRRRLSPPAGTRRAPRRALRGDHGVLGSRRRDRLRLAKPCSRPGDGVVTGWPSFPSYVLDPLKVGAVTVRVPLGEHRFDLEAIARGNHTADEARVYRRPERLRPGPRTPARSSTRTSRRFRHTS